MTEHRRRVGYLTALVGFLITVAGASVLVDWVNTGGAWQVYIKGPVWLLLGLVLAALGREFIDDARR